MYRDQSSTIHVLVKKRKKNSVDFYFFAFHFKKNGFENAKKKKILNTTDTSDLYVLSKSS